MSKVFLIISLLKRLSSARAERKREREREQHKNKELKSPNRFYNIPDFTMTPPPSSRGKGSSDDEFMNSPPKPPKKDASGGGMGSSPTLPKISEDAAVSSEKKSREMYASVTPQFALNSPMEASIAPTEKILKAELMEEFLTNKQQDNNSASTTETTFHATTTQTKEEQQQQQQQGAGMPQTTSNTGQNSSDNSDDDTSYHGRRKNFLFSKDDGNALTNEQRQIRRLLQLGYFLLHAAVIDVGFSRRVGLSIVWFYIDHVGRFDGY